MAAFWFASVVRGVAPLACQPYPFQQQFRANQSPQAVDRQL
jgi:hypothetical protein